MHHGRNWWCQSITTFAVDYVTVRALLKGTNLMLYSINEAVSVSFTYILAFIHMFIIMYLCSTDKVLKNVTRREEITMLSKV